MDLNCNTCIQSLTETGWYCAISGPITSAKHPGKCGSEIGAQGTAILLRSPGQSFAELPGSTYVVQ